MSHKVRRPTIVTIQLLMFYEEDLIRSVYKKGGMNPADTGYVEAHGERHPLHK
jgi:hypothetical protein